MAPSTAEILKSAEDAITQYEADLKKDHEKRSEEWNLVLWEITKIALLASEWLLNIGPNIDPQEIIWENPMDSRLRNDIPYSPFQEWLSTYFNKITQHFFNNVKISPELFGCIQKDSRMREDSDPHSFISIFTGSAIMDIYSLQLLHKYYEIPEQRLKWLLYKQMVSKSKWFRSIPSSLVLHDYCVEKVMAILEFKGEWKWDKKYPVCPFHHSDYKKDFIDAMWEVSKKLAPQIQEAYKDTNWTSNRFWSGNMNKRKDPSK